MKFNELYTEEKTRLDPKCWTGKKIGNPKTKMKGGVRVNNCVPAESVEETRSGNRMSDMTVGSPKIVYKNGRAVGEIGIDHDASPGNGPYYMKHYETNTSYSGYDTKKEALAELKHCVEQMNEQGVAEGLPKAQDGRYNPDGSKKQAWHKDPRWQQHAKDLENDPKNIYGGVGKKKVKEQGVAEEYNAEYDDEAGMADNNLETLERAVRGIDDLIQSGDNLPEWCQEKIAVAKSMLVAVWDYMESEEDSEEVDPEVDEMFEAMQELAEEMAAKNGVSVDAVWESLEALDDHMLYETAAWRRKEGKSKKGGLNAKGVASYRRENPGSKLQMAVTTKPSKLKPGSKAAKRRKSFCARMSGVKGPMKKPNGKPTRKALALRKWNC